MSRAYIPAFLDHLADMIEMLGLEFSYTIDDDGIHISCHGEEIYAGWLDAESLRAEARKIIEKRRKDEQTHNLP